MKEKLKNLPNGSAPCVRCGYVTPCEFIDFASGERWPACPECAAYPRPSPGATSASEKRGRRTRSRVGIVANPEHLEILRRGVKEWNAWRAEHPEIRPDLNGAYLEGDLL